MSPRFRRYLVRSLPALAVMLAAFWVLNWLWGDFSAACVLWSGLLIWAANVALRWAIRPAPERRE